MAIEIIEWRGHRRGGIIVARNYRGDDLSRRAYHRMCRSALGARPRTDVLGRAGCDSHDGVVVARTLLGRSPIVSEAIWRGLI